MIELQLEQPAPQHIEGLLPDPFAHPGGRFEPVERSPVRAARRQQRVQAVTQLGQETQARETQQGQRIAPGHDPPAVEEAHPRAHPVHLVRQSQLSQKPQDRAVGSAVKMVEALEPQRAEIEAGAHAAHPVVGFIDDGAVPVPHQLIRYGEAHGARA